jgi:hypothetical protein
MSLINDALKKAKQAQQPLPVPTAAEPLLRPVESARPAPRGASWAVPVALTALVLAGSLAVWEFVRPSPARATVPAQPPVTIAPAKPAPAPATLPVAQPARTPQTASPQATKPLAPKPQRSNPAPARQTAREPSKAPRVTSVSPTPPPSTTANVPPAPAPARPSPASTVAAPAPAPALASAAPPTIPAASQVTPSTTPEAAPPKPAPPKLQGVVLHPRKPSAVISGRTYFIGDRMGDLRVMAIQQDSVILYNENRTNVLTMD